METVAGSRRRFIAALIALPLFLSGLWRYLKPVAIPEKLILKVTFADIPVNGALVFRESRVAVMRDEHAVFALSLVCPHLGCTVSVTADEIICPCHGSRFNLKGEVVQGPADKALARPGIEIRGKEVYVYG